MALRGEITDLLRVFTHPAPFIHRIAAKPDSKAAAPIDPHLLRISPQLSS